MVQARLWPASAHQARLAFSFDLLDWAEALLLECQVSVHDFYKALYFKCPHLVFKVSNHVFKNLINIVYKIIEKRYLFIVVGCI